MPELPEVEVVKRSLTNNIKDLIIKKVTINNNKLRYLIKQNEFNKIVNKKILSIKRRSKYLLINLSQGLTILVHLGMTGKFFIVNESGKKSKTSFYYRLKENDFKHDHVIFHLNKKKKLIYNDVRKFGFIKLSQSIYLKKNLHLRLLGPEPLSDKFNIKYFTKYMINKKKKLKDTLMDQKFVSGLGNIYVNEILFLSSLNPLKATKSLKNSDMVKILYFTKKILKKSIKKGGSSIKNFKDSDGESGKFQQQFKVYAREGEKCPKNKCDGIIKKSNISNRSSFFCERCQK